MVEVSEKKMNESAIYRHPDSTKELKWKPQENINNLQDVINYSLEKNRKNEFLGSRDPITKKYKYKTFGEVYQNALWVGSGLQTLDLVPEVQEYKNYKLKLIGIFSKTREEWVTCDIANAIYGFTVVPLYDTLTQKSISVVLQNSNILSCFCSGDSIQSLIRVDNFYNLKNVILFEDIDEIYIKKLKEKSLKVYYYRDIIQAGKNTQLKLPNNIEPDHIFTLCYTSGSTGDPKGAIISHKNIISCILNLDSSTFKFSNNDTYLSYLPLAHILERFLIVYGLYSGCKIAFYQGEIMKLMDDFRDAQPTVLVSVPRIYSRIYENIQKELKQLKGIQKIIVDKAIASKLYYLEKTGSYKHTLYDLLVFRKIRNIFGGKVRIAGTGSAPLQEKIIQFLRIALGCPVLQGYGQTEGTGLELLQRVNDNTADNVGGVFQSLECKVVDVPEMNYYTNQLNQKEENKIKGELCVRGPIVFPGYYKDEEKTNECFDEEGWLHSGDIVEIKDNNSIKIIDKKKNIFKLSQGEYVVPEKVENIYSKYEGVSEIFLYGDSYQNYAVAIVVPKKDFIFQIAKDQRLNTQDLNEICQNQAIIDIYQKNLFETGKKEGLHRFEQAEKIYLEPNTFQKYELLTPSFKLQRYKAKEYFKQAINKMYDQEK